MLLSVAGCGDHVTMPPANGSAPDLTVITVPDGEQQSAACCDPVIVVAPGPTNCDPYLSLDGCTDDGNECMSAISDEYQNLSGGCNDTGGSGPDPTDTCPTRDPTCAGGPGDGSDNPEPTPSYVDDMARDTIPPDCSADDLDHWEQLYCFRALPPDSAQTRATLQALDQIAQRGDACAVVAERGRELLARGQIGFFVWQQGDSGGYGHRNTGIQLDEALVRFYGTQGSIFERTLVHEIDHVLGFLGHIDSGGTETPHTAQCG
jgi:hypothetical protein